MATTATSATTSTNIDVNSIVSQLMTVEQRPITKLNTQEASYQAKLSAYGSVKGAVASFQSAVQSLGSASKFQAVKATPSDTSVFSASASSIAMAGTYSLEVTSLAQAQKLVAAGEASSTDAIGSGAATTVTFDFGTISGSLLGSGKYDTGATFTSNGNGTKSITIDSSNNSLQGIRDAINAANAGVTATIVNDGSGTPYRLALSSDSSGASNSLKVSVSGDAGVSSLLANDPAGGAVGQNMAETVTAKNADFKVNGVAVSKASNSVSDVIQGVTLTLTNKTAVGSPVSLTVARDTAAISTSISSFVKAYNDLAAALKNVSAYDPASKRGAILQGDSTVRSLQAQLRSMLSTPVVGTSGALTTLSDVGVAFQKDGTLTLNQAKLSSAIANNFSDVASLFASVGKGTDSLVSFNSATSTAKPGNYAVNITQIATQGTSVGSVAANTTISAATNDALTLSINGVSASIVLSAGTYTAQTLAAELQSRINSASALSTAGIAVAVKQSGGVLSITSSSYGSASIVGITGGNGAADLLGTPTETAGVNVAGSIGGFSATGSGQILSAIAGDPQGMSITINGGALGARGVLNYSQGYAATLDKWSTTILASDGILSSKTDGISKTITDIGKRRDVLNTRLTGIQARYRAQFTALDAMLTSMNQTSTFLTQQLTKL